MHTTLPAPSSVSFYSAYAAAHAAVTIAHLAVSSDPPSYAASFSSTEVTTHSSVSYPLLDLSARWHIPLLICRALSTAPAAWWGLRCAFTFLGELLRSDETADNWTVEKRFRVTEVFLAILWVRPTFVRQYRRLQQKYINPLEEYALTLFIRIVLCGRLPVILLYGLPDVKMVGEAKASNISPL